jgi:hypothetical protein
MLEPLHGGATSPVWDRVGSSARALDGAAAIATARAEKMSMAVRSMECVSFVVVRVAVGLP